ncbi:hypothetical protein [Neisseria perflava]|uniref:hypothetical protein n=1 Tax=Neisseria perflava TaxID=33053 RepID=UPI00209D2F68|nr:hypothetical protein [Neisseria perflava]MCP1660658.1 L-ascorbate metabolism protein UlaG (beta-lactamase superfamily) [Neisseria perflava]
MVFKTDGKLFVTDPVFYRATPLPFGGAPFAQQNPTTTADLPPIDAVILITNISTTAPSKSWTEKSAAISYRWA